MSTLLASSSPFAACFLGLAESPSFGGSEGPDMTRYAVLSALMVALIGLMAFGLKRLVAGDLRRRAGERSLAVVDVLPLGGRHKVCVVRCYDRTFALGLGDKEVNVIAELDAVEEPEVVTSAKVAGAERRAFEAALERVRSQLNGSPRTEAKPAARRAKKSRVPATATRKVARKPAAATGAKRKPAPAALESFRGVVG